MDLAEIEGVPRIHPSPQLLTQTRTYYHETNIVPVYAIKYFNQVIYTLPPVTRPHAPDGDHDLLEWNSKLFLNLFLAFLYGWEILVVDGIVGDEHPRAKVRP